MHTSLTKKRPNTRPPGRGVSDKMIEHAAHSVYLKMRHITKATALDGADREFFKRQGWRKLHAGHIRAGNVALILWSWAHREVKYDGARARPSMDTLRTWGRKVQATISQVSRLTKDGNHQPGWLTGPSEATEGNDV